MPWQITSLHSSPASAPTPPFFSISQAWGLRSFVQAPAVIQNQVQVVLKEHNHNSFQPDSAPATCWQHAQQQTTSSAVPPYVATHSQQSSARKLTAGKTAHTQPDSTHMHNGTQPTSAASDSDSAHVLLIQQLQTLVHLFTASHEISASHTEGFHKIQPPISNPSCTGTQGPSTAVHLAPSPGQQEQELVPGLHSHEAATRGYIRALGCGFSSSAEALIPPSDATELPDQPHGRTVDTAVDSQEQADRVHRLLRTLQPHLGALPLATLANLLATLAAARVTPDYAWCDDFLEATQHELDGAPVSTCCSILSSLQILHVRPPRAWVAVLCKRFLQPHNLASAVMHAKPSFAAASVPHFTLAHHQSGSFDLVFPAVVCMASMEEDWHISRAMDAFPVADNQAAQASQQPATYPQQSPPEDTAKPTVDQPPCSGSQSVPFAKDLRLPHHSTDNQQQPAFSHPALDAVVPAYPATPSTSHAADVAGQRDALSTSEAVSALQALAELALRPEEAVVQHLLSVIAADAPFLSMPQVAAVLCSCCELGHMPSAATADTLLAAAAGNSLAVAETDHVVHLLESVHRLQLQPSPSFWDSIFARLQLFTASLEVLQLCHLLVAVAEQPVSVPQDWLLECTALITQRLGKMSTAELVACLEASAAARLPLTKAAITTACKRASELLAHFKPDELHDLIVAFASLKADIKTCGLATELCSYFEVAIPFMKPKQVSEVFSALARLYVQLTPRLFQLCLYGLYSGMAHLGTDGLEQALTALVWHKRRPDAEWMERFLKCVQQQLHHMSPGQLTQVLWACARLRFRPSPQWIDWYLSEAAGKLSCFSGHQLSQMAWSLAKIGYCPNHFWASHFLDKAQLQFRTSDARTLATLSWSLSTLELKPPAAWLDNFTAHSRRRFASSAPQSLAMTIWSLAKLGHKPSKDWLQEFLDASGKLSASFVSQDISNILYALAGFQHLPPADWIDGQLKNLVQALVTSRDSPAVRAQHVATVLHSLSVMQYTPPTAILDTLLSKTQSLLPGANPQTLAMAASALVRMSVTPPRDWLGTLMLCVHRQMTDIDARALVTIMWCLAKWNVKTGEKFIASVQSWQQANNQNLTPQLRALALWSAAKLWTHTPLANRMASVDTESPSWHTIALKLYPTPEQLSDMDARSLASLAYATSVLQLPKMRYSYCRHLCRALLRSLPSQSDQGVGMVVLCLGRLSRTYVPPVSWLRAFELYLQQNMRSLGHVTLSLALSFLSTVSRGSRHDAALQTDSISTPTATQQQYRSRPAHSSTATLNGHLVDVDCSQSILATTEGSGTATDAGMKQPASDDTNETLIGALNSTANLTDQSVRMVASSDTESSDNSSTLSGSLNTKTFINQAVESETAKQQLWSRYTPSANFLQQVLLVSEQQMDSYNAISLTRLVAALAHMLTTSSMPTNMPAPTTPAGAHTSSPGSTQTTNATSTSSSSWHQTQRPGASSAHTSSPSSVQHSSPCASSLTSAATLSNQDHTLNSSGISSSTATLDSSPATVHTMGHYVRPSSSWYEALASRLTGQLLLELDGQRLVVLGWALARLGYQATLPWLDAYEHLVFVEWEDLEASHRQVFPGVLQQLKDRAAA